MRTQEDSITFSEQRHPIDEMEPTEESQQQLADERAAQALLRLLQWVVGDSKKIKFEVIGKRALVVAALAVPDVVEGRSLAQLARAGGCTRASLDSYCVAFSDAFGVRGRLQKRESTRESYRASRVAYIERCAHRVVSDAGDMQLPDRLPDLPAGQLEQETLL